MPKEDKEKLKEVKNFYTEYINSANYKKRLIKQGYNDVEEVKKQRLSSLNKVKFKLSKDSYFSPVDYTVYLSPQDAISYNTDLSTIAAHELSHATGALMKMDYFNPGYLGLNKNEITLINKSNNQSSYSEDYIKGKVPLDKNKIHDSQPTEFKADLDALRFKLKKDGIYNTGTQEFNNDFLKKAKDKYKGDGEVDRLFKRVKDDDLIYLMNNLAQNNTPSQEQNTTEMAKLGMNISPKNKKKRASKLKLADGGEELAPIQSPVPSIFAPVGQEQIDSILKKTAPSYQVKPYLDVTPIHSKLPSIYDNVGQQNVDNILQKTAPSYQVKPYWDETPYDYSGAIASGITAIDALLPNKKPKPAIITPQATAPQNPFGTNSQAIAKNGGKIYKSNNYKDPHVRQMDGGGQVKNENFYIDHKTGLKIFNAPKGSLSEDELTYLGHKWRGNYSPEYLPLGGLYSVDGKSMQQLSPEQITQVSKYMQNTGTLTDIWQGLPNILSNHRGKNNRLMKYGGHIAYKSKSYDGGGTVDDKKMTLASNTHSYMPSDYKPFGDEKIGKDAGWYPIQRGTGVSTGQVKYKNDYGLLGDIELGEGKGKGYIGLAGNTNGLFDLSIYDENEKPVQLLAKSQPYAEINKYLTNNYGVVKQRVDNIKNGTNKDANPAEEQMARDLIATKKNGGKVKAKDGLYIEDNKFSQLSPSTLQVNGDTHADGGTDVHFNGTTVEAQKGEPLSMNKDGGVTLFGKMQNPLTGRTFEKDAKELAKKEVKIKKYLDEGTELLSYNSNNKWDMLKFNAGKAMFSGATAKLKEIDDSREHLSDVQTAMLDVKAEKTGKAKFGKFIAAGGDVLYNNILKRKVPSYKVDTFGQEPNSLNDVIVQSTPKMFNRNGTVRVSSSLFNPDISPLQMRNDVPSYDVIDNAPQDNSVMDEANEHPLKLNYLPYSNNAPTNAKNLSFGQILPELYTAATNQLEPVQMQQYSPDLYQSYQVSFDDRRNQNTSTFRASQQYLRDNPAAQSAIAAQAYEAHNNVNADEFRTNQGIAEDVRNKNISLINDAKLKNLQLADNQYGRQEQAKSNTKTQNRVVLQSIADKLHQNELEKQTIKLYENNTNFRFNPQTGKSEYYGAPGAELIDWNVYENLPKADQTRYLQEITKKRDKNGVLLSSEEKAKETFVPSAGKNKKKFGGNIPALLKKYN